MSDWVNTIVLYFCTAWELRSSYVFVVIHEIDILFSSTINTNHYCTKRPNLFAMVSSSFEKNILSAVIGQKHPKKRQYKMASTINGCMMQLNYYHICVLRSCLEFSIIRSPLSNWRIATGIDEQRHTKNNVDSDTFQLFKPAHRIPVD